MASFLSFPWRASPRPSVMPRIGGKSSRVGGACQPPPHAARGIPAPASLARLRLRAFRTVSRTSGGLLHQDVRSDDWTVQQ